ncbi:alpha,alpha-trehalose-phosphate synthase [UDP-forming]-like [Ischnura elegans]|uniref:alpha,alpha-trehalose-phosphate synthase [UDP-forming]-like n=1 Tax=Ischnura elegans TaxID=197161 RepID=UPI001ED8B72D|nr:alpha,alpha-trehalose-phosphate synthase [UDP-forming]-like [Ischnura elegans]
MNGVRLAVEVPKDRVQIGMRATERARPTQRIDVGSVQKTGGATDQASKGDAAGGSSQSSAPLIVVSNRLPFVLTRNAQGKLERKQSAGGLVTAVAPVVIDCKGLWVGWSGVHDMSPWEPIPESDPGDKAPTAGLSSSQVLAVNIEKEKFDAYYNGCCNGTFWPLFHSMPDRATFRADKWQAYCEVNKEFAERSVMALKKVVRELDDAGKYDVTPVVWVHDYQLLVAPTHIRQKAEEEGLRFKIGFFLHIPFPSWDIMRLFPWDDAVLQGMLACDLVGFHIEDYCLNFIDCCSRRLGWRVDRNRQLIEVAGRTVHVKALPIGIPYDRFVQLAETSPKVIKDETEKIILGVDRLDYTKGLVHRVKAFEKLLEKHPEFIEKVTLLQISVPSRTDVREYRQLKEEMDQLIGRVNGRFSKPNWSPIRYIYGCVSQEQLAAFYRDSAVALVTPLRDGMNLVAKEYVACQIREPGVLILSPFAGAGGSMHEALVVNPYELEEVAETIARALQMPLEEREVRMTQLRRREQQTDVTHWMSSFLKAVGASAAEDPEQSDFLSARMQPLSPDDFDQYLEHHVDGSCKLSLILDYDGTLAQLAAHPDLASMPLETKRVLERLANMPDVNIAIISGRSLENVIKMVGIDGVTYAGSHGLEILHPDGTKFVHPVPQEYAEKLRQLLRALQDEVCRDGAWVENKGVLLTFHYRETPHALREDIMKRAVAIFKKFGFEPHQAKLAIEAKPPVKWDQGRASIHILRTTYGVDWSERVRIVYAGNEDAMSALQGIACTFRVDSSPAVRSAANFRLAGPDAVLTMLKWVEKQMNRRTARVTPRASPRPPRSPISQSLEKGSPPHLNCIHSQMSYEEDDDDTGNGEGGAKLTYALSKSPKTIVKTVKRSKDEVLKKAV